jgi:hypothetical protein
MIAMLLLAQLIVLGLEVGRVGIGALHQVGIVSMPRGLLWIRRLRDSSHD